MVLQGPTVHPHARSFWRQALRWLAIVPFERPSESLVMARDLWDLGPHRAIDLIRKALHDPIEQKLRLAPAESLVVRGSRDALVPEDWARAAARPAREGHLAVPDGSRS
jgi:hypothetical protein